jgi:hypothetical protein
MYALTSIGIVLISKGLYELFGLWKSKHSAGAKSLRCALLKLEGWNKAAEVGCRFYLFPCSSAEPRGILGSLKKLKGLNKSETFGIEVNSWR